MLLIFKYENFGLSSSYDTLTETVRNLVEKSECGYTALELEKLLKVKLNETLLKLIDRRIITRKKMMEIIYISPHLKTIGQDRNYHERELRMVWI